MVDIKIELLEVSDSEELLIFEISNREFFERTCLSRGDSYYDIDNFNKIISELVKEQEAGLVYMYLIKDMNGTIVGRVNLVDVIRGNFNKAEIGYRIAQEYQGKGYGTRAVKLAVDEARKIHKLHRIEAGVSPDNIGSQVVLIKNGFNVVGRFNKYIFQGGKWHDNLNFELLLD